MTISKYKPIICEFYISDISCGNQIGNYKKIKYLIAIIAWDFLCW